MSAGERVANPFVGLTEAQHCRATYARDSRDRGISPTSEFAAAWCAAGALERKGFTAEDFEVIQFGDFLRSETGSGLETLNDSCHWTFAQFAAAWDRWQASK